MLGTAKVGPKALFLVTKFKKLKIYRIFRPTLFT